MTISHLPQKAQFPTLRSRTRLLLAGVFRPLSQGSRWMSISYRRNSRYIILITTVRPLPNLTASH
jgi:hypothetical protein